MSHLLKNILRTKTSLITLLFGVLFANQAAAIMVTNTNDSGTGSLRAAVAAGGTVTFSPSLIAGGSNTIVLSTPITFPSGSLTINGLMNTTDTLYISGGNACQLFIMQSGSGSGLTRTFNDLALINGNAGSSYGGAIYCTSGNLVLNHCVLTNNTAYRGGAVYFADYSTYSFNVSQCTFSANTSGTGGGAMYVESGSSSAPNSVSVAISNSTLSNNTASYAGAIFCSASITSPTNPGVASAGIYLSQSTVCDNMGSGAVYVSASASNNSSSSGVGTIGVTNSSIVNNQGNGLYCTGANSTINIVSSIVAGNTISNLHSPSINSSGKNIFSQSSITGSVASDQLGVTAAALNLSPLGFHGGNTRTMMPLAGSVAVNNGSSSTVNAQNGPILGVRDIGSTELNVSYGTAVVSSCGPYTWIDGVTYTSSNTTAQYTLTNSQGNDSIVTLNLTVYPDYNQTASAAICAGSSYQFGSQTLTAAGTYTEVFSSVHGCDSTVQLTLTVKQTSSSTETVQSCGPYTWSNGVTYTSSTNTPTRLLTNVAGCDSVVTLHLTIGDFSAPVPTVGSLPNVTAQCSVTALTAPTATDNCAGTITGTHNATLPITAQGTTVVTWTYNDGNGNTSTQTQNIVIADNTAPVADLAALPNVTAQCSVTALTAPTATDNCAGTITGTHNAMLPITAQGTTVVTWTYNDGHGNTSTQTQNIVIADNTAPVADLAALPNVTAQCSVTALTAPTATDNCAGTITGTHNASLPITAQGTTVVTWTYNDGNGNTSTQTQNIVIADNTAPVADLAALPNVTSQCSVTALTAPTATDNCAGTITGTHNASLPITAQGTTVVTWTYNDGNGNTSTQTQNIVIADNTAPVALLANLPALTAECEASPSAPSASDNCSGTLAGTPDISFPITAIGTTLVTWTYNDGNGNTSSQTQQITVTAIDNGITQIDAATLQANAAGYSYQWIDCDNGNAPVPGATGQTFTPAVSGNYACEVSNGNCTVTTLCSATTAGIAETISGAAITVYPNPTSGGFQLAFGEVFGEISVRIMDPLGQTISELSFGSAAKVELEIDGAPGMYLLEIQADGRLGRATVMKR